MSILGTTMVWVIPTFNSIHPRLRRFPKVLSLLAHSPTLIFLEDETRAGSTDGTHSLTAMYVVFCLCNKYFAMIFYGTVV